jgi:hypothetical protein
MEYKPELVLVPIYTPKGDEVYVEVENKYGPGWGLSDKVSAVSIGELSRSITKLFTTALEDVDVIKSAKIEFAISAQVEGKSLRLFVARGTNLSQFKITIEVECKKHSVAAK